MNTHRGFIVSYVRWLWGDAYGYKKRAMRQTMEMAAIAVFFGMAIAIALIIFHITD